MRFCLFTVIGLVVLSLADAARSQEAAARPAGKALTVHDMMAFRSIRSPAINADGSWIAYGVKPDRGDGEGRVRSVDGDREHVVPRGDAPVFSEDGRWVAMRIVPPFRPEGEKKPKTKPVAGAWLLDTKTGKTQSFERVESFSFSKSGGVLVLQHAPEKKTDESEKRDKGTPTEKPSGKAAEKPSEKKPETSRRDRKKERTLTVHFTDGRDALRIERVTAWAIAPSSAWIVTAVAPKADDGEDRLVARSLGADGASEQTLARGATSRFRSLTWAKETDSLAWVAADVSPPSNQKDESDQNDETKATDKKRKPGDETIAATLTTWTPGAEPVERIAVGGAPEGWFVPLENTLAWSKDAKRLFLGLRQTPVARPPLHASEALAEILAHRDLDVWHWRDPLINPHQKKAWPNEKKRTYAAVFDCGRETLTRLGDERLPTVRWGDGRGAFALGLDGSRYRREITWDGRYVDVYAVAIETGKRTLVKKRLRGGASRSPDGRFLAWYERGRYVAHDCGAARAVELKHPEGVPFANEDHDYPYPAPGYGIAGWSKDAAGNTSLIVYDKYDVWRFPLSNPGDAECLTLGKGRLLHTTFRFVKLDPEAEWIDLSADVHLTLYNQRTKRWALGHLASGQMIARSLEPCRYRFVAKAKEADRLLITRESYREFPDLWICGPRWEKRRKLTDVNPQVAEYAWGKAELVRYRNADGRMLDGVLIKPDDYEEGKRYPVVVYFYRYFSQRLHEWNEVVVNHRPCFAYYASNGYAVFLPDITFDVGAPGYAATKCLVPAVQKLITMGVADPDRIGLHGHSWSGYQTAFVITQTNLFKTAVAGAPVSNMTSAYGGIRWGSGMSRQFQYEQAQSRIGRHLWDGLPRYIENSPVFYADRIDTPLLIQFGDVDGAVPWYQGIELYMAMRRLEKPCVFLQYRGEPHHLKKYPNKLDYTLKMKAWFDHYLKDAPAPAWIRDGMPYRGDEKPTGK